MSFLPEFIDYVNDKLKNIDTPIFKNSNGFYNVSFYFNNEKFEILVFPDYSLENTLEQFDLYLSMILN